MGFGSEGEEIYPSFLGHMWTDYGVQPTDQFRFVRGRGFKHNQQVTQATPLDQTEIIIYV